MSELDPTLRNLRNKNNPTNPDPHPQYRIDPFKEEDWGNMPQYCRAGVPGLLAEINFVKAPEETKAVMESALQWQLEKQWLVHNETSPSRDKAPIVFLPDQKEYSCAPIDWETNKMTPSIRHYDQAEWVTEEMTADVLDSRKSDSVYVVGRIQGTDDLFNLGLIGQRLKELGYKEITLVTPCLGWTRQDRPQPKQGRPNTTAFVSQFLSKSVDRIAVLKTHSNEAGRNALINETPFCNFSGWKYLADQYLNDSGHLLRKINKDGEVISEGEELVVIGPDEGGKGESYKLAAYLSEILGYEVKVVALDKGRDPENGKIAFQSLTEEKRKLLEEKTALIIDDVIGTASTTGGIEKLISEGERGVKKTILLSTHASLQDKAIEILTRKGFDSVYITNSRDPFQKPPVDGNIHSISCLPLIEQFIENDRNPNFNPWQHPDFQDIVC